MDFDTCIYRLHEIGRSDEEEISSRFRQLAFDVSKNGIMGLVPIEEGGITDGVPFNVILTTLQSGMEQTSSSLVRLQIESLYNDLISEGVDGYRQ
ncbi:hypothetical protein [Enterococcus faecium]|uniref:hypothetical protein n=1 Tax=Enterococcus TaxID=1350 RepID=UPI000A32D2F4|nr:hypothetical protein [Enterococcus faecium]OTN78271.1 hypothetical protein A5826_002123 [Enterococcus faecium]